MKNISHHAAHLQAWISTVSNYASQRHSRTIVLFGQAVNLTWRHFNQTNVLHNILWPGVHVPLRKVKIICGRYQFTADQCAEILQIVQEIERRCGPNAWNPGEIRPTALAPVLVASSAGIQPELYAWGYKLPKSLVINARGESAMEKPLFRDSVRSKCCVIPSTGFFGWNKEKRKYFFKLPSEVSVEYDGSIFFYRFQNPEF